MEWEWWVYVVIAAGLVLALLFFAALVMMAITTADTLLHAFRTTSQPPCHDDVECPCCGLSPLESVRSTTGQDACICCGRRPYRTRPRRRRDGRDDA
jgi:hypothetical protein